MFISVIIPVFNGRHTLPQCLHALNQTNYNQWECIVVDDGSTDDSAVIACEAGARVVNSPHGGPAMARNLGARATQGDVLFFIDADVLVRPDTLSQVAAILRAHPEVAACFGSYDDMPTERNFLSQYRNLLHHYTHQQGSEQASTFWSGCGAIRRDVFLAIGGFDTAAFPRPSIEDIELGYRLRTAGYTIRLEKSLQVTHLKRWTARQVFVTDVRDRAIPWSRLILQKGAVLNDLNLQTPQRWSTAAVFAGLAGLFSALLSGWGMLVVGAAVFLLLWLNRDFYQFLWRKRGLLFLLMALPWHWFYFFYSGMSFAAVLVLHRSGLVKYT
jgi:glycosyltransferase involved in cell wall biosynthesis